MNTETQAVIASDALRFPSLTSLLAAHRDLLKLHRESGDTPETIAAMQDLVRRGQAAGALLDSDGDRQAAQSLLDYWATCLYRLGHEPPEAILADFDPALAPELDDALCPYLGLDAFREKDWNVFFGRQRLVESLVNHLKTNRLLAVVGPSGSGKSSVVSAGLVPALKAGALPGSEDWAYLPPMVPGSNPFQNLAQLTRPAKTAVAEWVQSQIVASRQNPQHLAQLVAGHFGENVVLVVDQFEELFTLCEDDRTRQAFIENLVGLAQAPEAGHLVILTMRTDFESHVTRLPDFQPLFEEAEVRVTPLNASELRDAIQAPANLIGLRFEEGVVEALLNDVLGEPAALPLLQFTLLKLWEHRERNRVTWEAYRRLEGGRKALTNSADEFYHNLLPEEQVTARRILLRLVRPGEGPEVTGNRMRRESLFHKAEARDRIERVLNKFIQARLLRLTKGDVPADDQIEVAHEALVRNWLTLVEWLEEERTRIRERQRLTSAAEQWRTLGENPDLLLRGVLLDQALRYEGLGELEDKFVKASQAALKAEEAEKEAARQKELADARRLAEETEARRRAEAERALEAEESALRLRARNRTITNVSILAFLLAILAVIFGGWAGMTASRNARLAADNRKIAEIAQANASTAEAASIQAKVQRDHAAAGLLALQAQSIKSSRPDLGLLLTLEAIRLNNASEVRGSLLDVLQASPRLKAYLRGHISPVLGLAFQDNKTLVSGSSDSAISLWDVANGKLVGQPLAGYTGTVSSAAFSHDGKTLALSGEDNSITLWDVAGGKPVGQPFTGHTNRVASIAFSPDGNTLASGSCGELDAKQLCIRGEIRLWDVASGQLRGGAPYTGHTDQVRSVAFNPDGNLLASGSADKTIILWDIANSKPISQPLTSHAGAVTSVAFSRDGKLLASGGADRSVILWDVANHRPLGLPLTGHTSAVTSVAFSPDGKTLASSGSADKTIRLWDVSRRLFSQSLVGHTGDILGVAFSPDGKTLASGSADKTVILWNMVTPARVSQWLGESFVGQTASVSAVALSSDGKILASRSNNGIISLWDVASGQLMGRPLIGYTGTVSTAAFSPDRKTLAVSNEDKTVIVWDVTSGQPISHLIAGRSSKMTSIAFSPDGKTLALGGCGELDAKQLCIRGEIQLWDVASGQLRGGAPLTGHTGDVRDVAFSPDGKILASGSADKTIILWNIASSKPISQPLSGHGSAVTSVAFSWDGKMLASGSLDNTARLWDVANRKPLGLPLTGHIGDVFDVAFSPDGKTLASGSADNAIRLWDVTSGKLLGQPLSGHAGDVLSVAFSADGKTVVSRGADNTVRLWDVATRKFLGQPFTGRMDSVYSLAFGPDGETLVSASSDGSAIILWDVKKERRINQPLVGHNAKVSSAVFSPDGRMLASGGEDNIIILWDVASGKLIGQPLTGHTSKVTSVAFSPDSKTLASGSCGELDANQLCIRGEIRLWDVASGQPLGGTPLAGHIDEIRSMAFSLDGKRLVSGGTDKTVILWDVASGKPIGQPFTGHISTANSVAFSPDGKMLASGSADKTIILWNMASGKPISRTLTGHINTVNSVAFSLDGKTLASGSADNTVRLWDVASGKPLGQPLVGYNDDVLSVVYSPDGQTVVSGSADRMVIQWNVNFESWKDFACQAATRNLTMDEWQQYLPDEVYRTTCPQWPEGK